MTNVVQKYLFEIFKSQQKVMRYIVQKIKKKKRNQSKPTKEFETNKRWWIRSGYKIHSKIIKGYETKVSRKPKRQTANQKTKNYQPMNEKNSRLKQKMMQKTCYFRFSVEIEAARALGQSHLNSVWTDLQVITKQSTTQKTTHLKSGHGYLQFQCPINAPPIIPIIEIILSLGRREHYDLPGLWLAGQNVYFSESHWWIVCAAFGKNIRSNRKWNLRHNR